MDIALAWTSTMLALVATILSVLVAKAALSQTQTIHEYSHNVAVEGFERDRFDALFAASDRILESIADFKADLQPYWKESPDSLRAKTGALELLEAEIAVHRSLEHYFAHSKSLDVAIAGLPRRDEAWGELGLHLAAVQASQRRLQLAAAWLGACAMSTYSSLVTGNLGSGTDETHTDHLVLTSIRRNRNWQALASSDEQNTYFTVIRDNRIATRARQSALDAEIEAEGRTGPRRPDGAPNVAFSFLESAEEELVEQAKALSADYAELRIAEARARLSARRGFLTGLSAKPPRSRSARSQVLR